MKSRIGIALLSIAMLPFSAFAQEVSAGITGRVTDPSGGAIVNASVTAKDLARGTEWPAKTNQEGIYFFPRVPVGSYEVKVEAQGFQPPDQVLRKGGARVGHGPIWRLQRPGAICHAPCVTKAGAALALLTVRCPELGQERGRQA